MHTNSVTYIEYETTITESCSCTCTRIVDICDAELAAKGEKVKRAKGGAELLEKRSRTKKFSKFFHATGLRKIKSLFTR